VSDLVRDPVDLELQAGQLVLGGQRFGTFTLELGQRARSCASSCLRMAASRLVTLSWIFFASAGPSRWIKGRSIGRCGAQGRPVREPGLLS